MKAKQFKQNDNSPYLTVVNNSIGKKITLSEEVNRININTLIPGFNYINHKGDVVSPKNAVLL
ncbi:MAG TPA: hypothetical protein VIN72_06295 [Lutibacter sp.]